MLLAVKRQRGVEALKDHLCGLHSHHGGASWLLNDCVGASSVADLMGRVNGTPSATGLTFGANGPIINGDLALACAFNGAAGFVSVAPSPIDPSGAFSFSCWLNCTNPSGTTRQSIMGCGKNANNRFSAQIAIDIVRCSYFDGTTTYSRSTTFTTGWHHLCITKAAGGNTPSVYVDGAVGTGTGSATLTGVDKTVIGARNDTVPTLFFGGSIMGFSFFNSVLTLPDIHAITDLGRY